MTTRPWMMFVVAMTACEPASPSLEAPSIGPVGARAEAVVGLHSSSDGGDVVVVEGGDTRDATDVDWIEVPAGETREMDITTQGPGGLDTGDPEADTAYALWIAKDTASGDVSALASETFDAAGVVLPSGVLIRRIGALATDADGELLAFTQSGVGDREVAFESEPGIAVLVDGAASVFETIELGPAAPEIAAEVRIHVVPSGTSSASTTLRADAGGATTTVSAPTTLDFMPSAGTSRMDYKNDTSGGLTNIAVVGFRDAL